MKSINYIKNKMEEAISLFPLLNIKYDFVENIHIIDINTDSLKDNDPFFDFELNYISEFSLIFPDEDNHSIVNHAKEEYVNIEDNTIHSNTIEGAWKIFKNSSKGMYNHVSKKHLQYYVDEFVYRYNTRDLREADKFNWLLLNSNVRTTYNRLIA